MFIYHCGYFGSSFSSVPTTLTTSIDVFYLSLILRLDLLVHIGKPKIPRTGHEFSNNATTGKPRRSTSTFRPEGRADRGHTRCKWWRCRCPRPQFCVAGRLSTSEQVALDRSKIGKISKILQFFGGLVLGCIKTKFCKKICV